MGRLQRVRQVHGRSGRRVQPQALPGHREVGAHLQAGRHEGPPQGGARGRGRLAGALDLLRIAQVHHGPLGDQARNQSGLGVEVVVGQVHPRAQGLQGLAAQLGVALALGAHEATLDGPVDLGVDGAVVVVAQRGDDAGRQVGEQMLGAAQEVRHSGVVQVGGQPLQEGLLDVDGAQAPALDGGGGHVPPGALPQCGQRDQRVGQGQVAEVPAGLEGVQEQQGHGAAQPRRRLGHGGVGAGDVQAAQAGGVGVGLVAGVDQGALPGGVGRGQGLQVGGAR